MALKIISYSRFNRTFRKRQLNQQNTKLHDLLNHQKAPKNVNLQPTEQVPNNRTTDIAHQPLLPQAPQNQRAEALAFYCKHWTKLSTENIRKNKANSENIFLRKPEVWVRALEHLAQTPGEAKQRANTPGRFSFIPGMQGKSHFHKLRALLELHYSKLELKKIFIAVLNEEPNDGGLGGDLPDAIDSLPDASQKIIAQFFRKFVTNVEVNYFVLKYAGRFELSKNKADISESRQQARENLYKTLLAPKAEFIDPETLAAAKDIVSAAKAEDTSQIAYKTEQVYQSVQELYNLDSKTNRWSNDLLLREVKSLEEQAKKILKQGNDPDRSHSRYVAGNPDTKLTNHQLIFALKHVLSDNLDPAIFDEKLLEHMFWLALSLTDDLDVQRGLVVQILQYFSKHRHDLLINLFNLSQSSQRTPDLMSKFATTEKDNPQYPLNLSLKLVEKICKRLDYPGKPPRSGAKPSNIRMGVIYQNRMGVKAIHVTKRMLRKNLDVPPGFQPGQILPGSDVFSSINHYIENAVTADEKKRYQTFRINFRHNLTKIGQERADLSKNFKALLFNSNPEIWNALYAGHASYSKVHIGEPAKVNAIYGLIRAVGAFGGYSELKLIKQLNPTGFELLSALIAVHDNSRQKTNNFRPLSIGVTLPLTRSELKKWLHKTNPKAIGSLHSELRTCFKYFKDGQTKKEHQAFLLEFLQAHTVIDLVDVPASILNELLHQVYNRELRSEQQDDLYRAVCVAIAKSPYVFNTLLQEAIKDKNFASTFHRYVSASPYLQARLDIQAHMQGKNITYDQSAKQYSVNNKFAWYQFKRWFEQASTRRRQLVRQNYFALKNQISLRDSIPTPAKKDYKAKLNPPSKNSAAYILLMDDPKFNQFAQARHLAHKPVKLHRLGWRNYTIQGPKQEQTYTQAYGTGGYHRKSHAIINGHKHVLEADSNDVKHNNVIPTIYYEKAADLLQTTKQYANAPYKRTNELSTKLKALAEIKQHNNTEELEPFFDKLFAPRRIFAALEELHQNYSKLDTLDGNSFLGVLSSLKDEITTAKEIETLLQEQTDDNAISLGQFKQLVDKIRPVLPDETAQRVAIVLKQQEQSSEHKIDIINALLSVFPKKKRAELRKPLRIAQYTGSNTARNIPKDFINQYWQTLLKSERINPQPDWQKNLVKQDYFRLAFRNEASEPAEAILTILNNFLADNENCRKSSAQLCFELQTRFKKLVSELLSAFFDKHEETLSNSFLAELVGSLKSKLNTAMIAVPSTENYKSMLDIYFALRNGARQWGVSSLRRITTKINQIIENNNTLSQEKNALQKIVNSETIYNDHFLAYRRFEADVSKYQSLAGEGDSKAIQQLTNTFVERYHTSLENNPTYKRKLQTRRNVERRLRYSGTSSSDSNTTERQNNPQRRLKRQQSAEYYSDNARSRNKSKNNNSRRTGGSAITPRSSRAESPIPPKSNSFVGTNFSKADIRDALAKVSCSTGFNLSNDQISKAYKECAEHQTNSVADLLAAFGMMCSEFSNTNTESDSNKSSTDEPETDLKP